MLNQNSINQVSDFKLDSNFFKPHPHYNIKYLLNSIYKSLGINNGKTLPTDCFKEKKEYMHTVFVLLDGFGYSLLEEVLPTLPNEIRKFIEKELHISKLTTLFPSTTSAIIPFLATGYLPEESGIYEWWQYEHTTGKTFIPFLYTYWEDGKNISMENLEDIDPKNIYKESLFYNTLQKNGIDVFVYTNPMYLISPFNKLANQKICTRNSHRMTNQRVDVVQDIEDNFDKKSFHYIYDPDIDAVEHGRGRNSKEAIAIAKNKLFELYELLKEIKERDWEKDVQVIIAADHGLTQFEGDNVLMLDTVMHNLYDYMKTNKDGKHITFGGSPRALVLHIKEDMKERFINDVQQYIKGRAEVFTTEELFKKGLLNSEIEISEAFTKNFGNITILSYDHQGIWFDAKNLPMFKGHHGGLSEDELHIPLMVF
ncbi:alkaline phosphatase family protein [bacterium]|nr:alkaline phosphatase family protein [bacterium]